MNISEYLEEWKKTVEENAASDMPIIIRETPTELSFFFTDSAGTQSTVTMTEQERRKLFPHDFDAENLQSVKLTGVSFNAFTG